MESESDDEALVTYGELSANLTAGASLSATHKGGGAASAEQHDRGGRAFTVARLREDRLPPFGQ